VPLMIGANSADAGGAVGATVDELFGSFGEDKIKAEAAYDPGKTGELPALRAAVGADRGMVEPARFVARLYAAKGVPTYEYRFSYVAESMRSKWKGAPHATEIPFVFDTVKARYEKDTAASDEKMEQDTLSYWVAFAKTANPNAPGLPEWPAYTAAGDQLMNFTQDGPVAQADPWKARLDVTAAYMTSHAP
jgi:para-nitrobenzyl esterase